MPSAFINSKGSQALSTGMSIVAMTMQAATQLTNFHLFHCFTEPA